MHGELTVREPAGGADRLTRLAALVQRKTGLDMNRTGYARRLTPALAGLPDPDQLAPLPDGSPEWQSLLAAILIPETYLFRDPGQLALMTQIGFGSDSIGRLPDRTLRLWSAGCCTGEEAYSLAILVMQAFIAAKRATEVGDACQWLDGWRIDVLGTDISSHFLKRAVSASYPTGVLSPFRATPPDRMRFFPPAGPSRRVVRGDVRRLVRFRREGLLASGAPPITGCQVVACRNVLMYLSQAARHQALSVLSRAVAPGGLLLLGPTDPAPDSACFAQVWSQDSLVYQRGAAE